MDYIAKHCNIPCDLTDRLKQIKLNMELRNEVFNHNSHNKYVSGFT